MKNFYYTLFALCFSVSITFAQTTRFPLLETFTSSTCPPCNSGNINMEGVLDQNPGGYVSIKYQQNFPGTGDPYTTAEAVSRRSFYSVNSIPNTQIDGQWNGNSGSFSQAVYNQFKNIPSYLDMKVTYSLNGQTISGNVEITPLQDFNQTSLKIYIAIIEKRTVSNIATNGETEFINVMKKMLPSQNGSWLGALSNGQTVTKPFTYTFQGNYRLPANGLTANQINHSSEHSVENFNNLEVVAWVQDQTDKKVLQAMDSRISLGTEELNLSKFDFQVYPNPASSIVNVSLNESLPSNAQLELSNMLGQTIQKIDLKDISDKVQLNVANLKPGIYLMTLSSGSQRITKKLIIK